MAIVQAYNPDPNNPAYRFRHYFHNVVPDPRQRTRPEGVDELTWRGLLDEVGGEHNAEGLWPVPGDGFKTLQGRACQTMLAPSARRTPLSSLSSLPCLSLSSLRSLLSPLSFLSSLISRLLFPLSSLISPLSSLLSLLFSPLSSLSSLLCLLSLISHLSSLPSPLSPLSPPLLSPVSSLSSVLSLSVCDAIDSKTEHYNAEDDVVGIIHSAPLQERARVQDAEIKSEQEYLDAVQARVREVGAYTRPHLSST